MGFLSFNITEIVSNLLKIGSSVTESQLITLKWRLSDQGQRYYTQEQTNQFYTALRKGDVNVIDLVRKDKQDIIENLKQDLLLS